MWSSIIAYITSNCLIVVVINFKTSQKLTNFQLIDKSRDFFVSVYVEKPPTSSCFSLLLCVRRHENGNWKSQQISSIFRGGNLWFYLEPRWWAENRRNTQHTCSIKVSADIIWGVDRERHSIVVDLFDGEMHGMAERTEREEGFCQQQSHPFELLNYCHFRGHEQKAAARPLRWLLTAAAAHFFGFGKSCLEFFSSLTLAVNRRKQKSNKNLQREESIKEIKLELLTACDDVHALKSFIVCSFVFDPDLIQFFFCLWIMAMERRNEFSCRWEKRAWDEAERGFSVTRFTPWTSSMCDCSRESDGEVECGKWKSQVLADPSCVVIVRLQMEDRNNASIRERSLRLAEGWAFDIFRVSFVLFEVGEGLKSFWEDWIERREWMERNKIHSKRGEEKFSRLNSNKIYLGMMQWQKRIQFATRKWSVNNLTIFRRKFIPKKWLYQ